MRSALRGDVKYGGGFSLRSSAAALRSRQEVLAEHFSPTSLQEAMQTALHRIADDVACEEVSLLEVMDEFR